MQIHTKLPQVGTTIFTVMSALAQAQGAINLSQGFPDFDPDDGLKERVSFHMAAGRNQYAPMQGVPELRQQISLKHTNLYGHTYDPETEVTVTAGATEALFAAITAVVRPGDEVMIFEPAYDAYVPVVTLNGGRPVYVPMSHPDYRIDWDAARKRIGPKTSLLILNFPHNPSGAALTDEDLTALGELVDGSRAFILSDEVYEHILFDGRSHLSMATQSDLAARSFVVSSFGKTFHTTGWKIGYCLAPQAMSAELRKIHQFVTFAVNTPIQLAYADFLAQPKAYLELDAFYQQKRDLFRNLMAGSRFRMLPCAGTFFQMADYSAINSLPDVEFARWITEIHKVAVIPPSVFYHNGADHRVVRFCFAKNDETLREAAQLLCKI